MELKCAGQVVAEVLIGFTVTIRIGESSEFELQIEGDFELGFGAEEVVYASAAERRSSDSFAGSVGECMQ